MDVPAIGRAKGLFEIFIPGVFLLLNFACMLYFLQLDGVNSNLYNLVKENQILMGVLIIVFGYLTGVILWLARADLPDNLSARLRRDFRSLDDFCRRFLGKKPKGALAEFYTEEFPYLESLGTISKKHLPDAAYSFYLNCWYGRKSISKNKYFFNYCKSLINSVDVKSATEIYSSEALIRYLAAMFYAILISLVSWALVLLLILLFYSFSPLDTSIKMDSVIFIIFYLISILTLLWHFRYMRFKEVQTVFTASLINKESIDQYLSDNPKCSQQIDRAIRTSDDTAQKS